MEIWIVRHAETLDNLRHICQGQLDGQLSPMGHHEADLVAERLSPTLFHAAYCSDLGRAKETMHYITKRHPYLMVNYDPRIRERYFGSFQGQPFPPEHDESFFPPETETVEQIMARLNNFLHDLALWHGESDRVLLLSHGFTIRVLIALLQGLPPSEVWSIPEIFNTSITTGLWSPPHCWQRLSFNDNSHILR